jgi:hypothetical protein
MSTVTSAEFQRNVGLYQDKALTEPVTITKNGRVARPALGRGISSPQAP